jgi:hypothetical protein
LQFKESEEVSIDSLLDPLVMLFSLLVKREFRNSERRSTPLSLLDKEELGEDQTELSSIVRTTLE